MRYSFIRDVSVFELSTYTRVQLKELSGRIADNQIKFLAEATTTELAEHFAGEMEFGIKISKGETIASRGKRASDQAFWFRRLSQIAGRTRETIAIRSGQVGGAEPYCSSETFNEYLQKQSARSVDTRTKLQRQFERAATQNYLMSRAACDRAFKQGHLSVFITLGLDGRHHSSSYDYAGYSFDYSYKVLHKMLDVLLEDISHYGVRGVDFYGARCVEVHKDGCPHLHILLYIKPCLLWHLKSKLSGIHHNQSRAMGNHYDVHTDQILQVREPKDRKLYGEAVSYIFKNAYAGRHNDADSFECAIRQKAVISLYGKHQYELIGMNGSSSVIREASKHLQLDEMTCVLGLRKAKNRRTNWINIVREIVSGGTNRFKLIRTDTENRYGEKVRRVIDVKPIPSLASEKAFHFKPKPGVISNYSRDNLKSAEPAPAVAGQVLKSCYRSRAPPSLAT